MSPSAGPGDRGFVRGRPDKESPIPGAGIYGLAIFLASLSMLFASSLVAYLVIRLRADTWRPEGEPVLPWGVWLSTLLLGGCSLLIQQGLNRIRQGKPKELEIKLWWTVGLALLFVANQSWNWVRMMSSGSELREQGLYAFTFFMLTALHALHVVGGVVGLVFVLVRTRAGAYSWAHYPGVRYNTIYWHYLGIVWVILLVTMFFGSVTSG